MSAFSFSPCSRLPRPDEGGDADDRHRQRREQERGADDRADRDVLGALGAADDRDDRDQGLRHRGADRGEQAADGPLPQLQLVADPLDGVREEERPAEEDGEADCEENDRHQATKKVIPSTA